MQSDAINLVPSKRNMTTKKEFFENTQNVCTWWRWVGSEGEIKQVRRDGMEHCRCVLWNCLGKRNFNVSFHYQSRKKKHHMTELLVEASFFLSFFFSLGTICIHFFLNVFLLQKMYLARKIFFLRNKEKQDWIDQTNIGVSSAKWLSQEAGRDEKTLVLKKHGWATKKKRKERKQESRKKHHLKGRKNMWHTDFERHCHCRSTVGKKQEVLYTRRVIFPGLCGPFLAVKIVFFL